MDTTTEDTDRQTPVCPQRVHKGRIGLIVAASLAMGLLAAIVLVAATFVPATEHVLTGVVLLACAGLGRCWPYCRSGSATSRSGGRRRRLCSPPA